MVAANSSAMMHETHGNTPSAGPLLSGRSARARSGPRWSRRRHLPQQCRGRDGGPVEPAGL